MVEKQYVIFQLHTEEYGIDINYVQEIVLMQEITKIPQASELMEGVIQMRGRIIPVVDLKKRFYGLSNDIEADRRIIIVDIGSQSVGIIADQVWEVLRIREDLIEPPPPLMGNLNSSGVAGIGKLENRLLIILDLAGAFTAEEKSVLEAEQNITNTV